MDAELYLRKDVSYTTRDFVAESVANDGTEFHVEPRHLFTDMAVSSQMHKWWNEHRFDSSRGSFSPNDPEGTYLECHDETEAKQLVVQLQRDYNKVAL